MTVWKTVAPIDGALIAHDGPVTRVQDVNHVVDFDSPFFVIPNEDGTGAVLLTDGDRPQTATPHAPRVTVHPADGSVLMDAPGWLPVDGYSGQHGYDGPIMHPSELLGGGIARDLLAGVMGSGWFAVVAVFSETCDDFAAYGECGVSNPPADGDAPHECTDEPAGWMLVHRPVDLAGHDVRGQW